MLFGLAMIDDSLITAFDRLEQALIRLEDRLPERLAERPSPAEPSHGGADARYLALKARHEALRARTAAAVEQLDTLVDPASEAPVGDR